MPWPANGAFNWSPQVKAYSNPGSLYNWWAALANRDNAEAKIVCIGDSITEGNVAGSLALRWQALLQTKLRARYPVTGVATPGAGYIPAVTVTGAPVSPTTVVGGTLNFLQFGLGLKVIRVKSTESVQWPATTCDRFKVFYAQSSVGGGGTVSTDAVDVGSLSIGSSDNDGHIFDSGAITAASHTVKVRGQLSGFGFPVWGAQFYNGDFGKGVHVFDAGHFGSGTSNFVTAFADSGHWLACAAVAPALYVINLGVNDWGIISVAQYLANIDTILAKIATANGTTPYSVLLVKPYRPASGAGPNADWAAMMTGLEARTGDNVATFDIQAWWPSLVAGGATNYGLMYETATPLHPNPQGHGLYAELMYRAIGIT